ncbi:MAG: bL28 family ribosomal protein [Defluviitaleaceae bacterium]|nr:bL28 family ribosomal protein [Defluviitaleaceae bacterium]
MARCSICDKGRLAGHRISITRSNVSRRANRYWRPNVKKVRVTTNGNTETVKMCTACLRNMKTKSA